jgi:polyferredoxin
MKKVHLRKLVIIISFLLLPITFIYISPVIIILDAAEGIISGSFILFCLLFLSSMLSGRLFCAWLCPAGGVQECMMSAINKPVKNSKPLHIIRHIIWVVWLGFILYTAVSGGGYRTVAPFNHSYMGLSLHTEGGLAYPIYFFVLAIIIILTLTLGRRSACHSMCHMANFMIIGKKLGRLLRLPQIHLKMNPAECIGCKKCSLVCPMSLDVENMVKQHHPENPYCISCGDCVQACSKGAIRLAFGRPEKGEVN